jgi:hypothetical protein
MGGFLVKTFWKFGRCELLCGFVNVVTYLTFDFFCRSSLSVSLRYRARFYLDLSISLVPEYRVL